MHGRQSCPFNPKYNMAWDNPGYVKAIHITTQYFSLKHVTRISTLLQAPGDAYSGLLPMHHTPGAL